MAFATKTKIKKKHALTLPQRELLARMARAVTGSIDAGGIDAYEGTIVPDPTEGQADLFEALDRGFDRRQLDEASEFGLLEMLSGEAAFDVDPAARRELYDAEKAVAMREWQEEMMPAIARMYGARGAARSGALTDALAKSGADLSEDLYRRNTELLYADENMRRQELSRARDRIGAGVAADQAYRRGQVGDVAGQLDVMDAARGIQGQQNAEAYGKWQQEQPWANPWLGIASPVLGTQPYMFYQKEKPGWGQYLQAGIGALGGLAGMMCSRQWKRPAGQVDEQAVLGALELLPIERWSYAPGPIAEVYGEHERIGPYAEDWARVFGGDGQVIHPVDALGVALAAVKALTSRISELEARLAEKESRL